MKYNTSFGYWLGGGYKWILCTSQDESWTEWVQRTKIRSLQNSGFLPGIVSDFALLRCHLRNLGAKGYPETSVTANQRRVTSEKSECFCVSCCVGTTKLHCVTPHETAVDKHRSPYQSLTEISMVISGGRNKVTYSWMRVLCVSNTSRVITPTEYVLKINEFTAVQH